MPLSDRPRAVAALLAASFLFGVTFVVIKWALDDIGPLTFVAWRFLIGAAALALFAMPRGKKIWRHGLIAGLGLAAGFILQTAGLALTSVSASALITGLYVVLTPLLAALFRRRPPSAWVVSAAAVSFVGLFLLTAADDVTLNAGDLLTLGCALAFAFHIVALSRYARRHPVVPFTAAQLTVVAAVAFPAAWLLEGPSLPSSSVIGALALTGLGVCVGAFLLQVWAQTVIGPGTAAVVLAAEPAFGVAAAWVALGERLEARGWAGALLIVIAIYMAVTMQPEGASREAESVTEAH